ncbi:unnamed protein product [Linum tenue]|uniref:Uncharacterized protein n=1 Tax=Linum tenue TaxID=586396 RepID=A0AAV0R4D4_9ROSI|nr:unnamed protein product [Linum tenue]
MNSSKSHSHQQAAAAATACGGKTARACDSCIRRRARWYCAADDAFLCQSCDSSVHSANPLARRHERVRLKTASLKSLSLPDDGGGGGGAAGSLPQQPASWHRGFTRKPRTPRANGATKTTSFSSPPSVSKSSNSNTMRAPLVPEVGSDDHDEESAAAEEEHQLLYRVPIFDPLELCNSDDSFPHHHHHHHQSTVSASNGSSTGGDSSNQESLLHMQGLVLPSDMELAEFAADVESLLGNGLENESFGMEELGILDCSNKDDGDVSKMVKMEITGELLNENHKQYHDGGGGGGGGELVVMECGGGDDDSDEPPFQLSFEYGDEEGATCHEEEEEEKMVMQLRAEGDEVGDNMEIGGKKRKRNILLRLNYEAVMAAWDTTTQGSASPWTNGRRPEFDVNECWPDCMGGCGREYLHHHQHHLLGYQLGEGRSLGAATATAGDGGREARVSRYREKRRTRLFSKKIRYEVRKLNAEKRPRMKGRFVKRASFAAASTTTALPNYTSLVLHKK